MSIQVSTNTPQERKALIQKRIDNDLLSRSLPGVLIYAILWPIIFYANDLHKVLPKLCWGLSIAFFVLSLLRGIQAKYTDAWYRGHEESWLYFLAFCSLAQATLWGFLFFSALTDPLFESVRLTLILAAGAMSSGAVTALIPRRWIALTNISLILVPGILGSLLINGDKSLFVLLAIYLVYLLILGNRAYAEYLRAFEIESELDKQKQTLEQLNKIDPLTGIYNRGYFNSMFEFQWNNAVRTQHEQSLILIDIDNFKLVNDKHGHLVGDETLKLVAKQIHDIAQRRTDIISRFGGEEFAILLSNTSFKEAINIAENIRKKVAEKPLSFKQKILNMSVSIGVASIIPKKNGNLNELIEMADQALYKAKSDGRNLTRFYDPRVHLPVDIRRVMKRI